jgi:hypothetical protein
MIGDTLPCIGTALSFARGHNSHTVVPEHRAHITNSLSASSGFQQQSRSRETSGTARETKKMSRINALVASGLLFVSAISAPAVHAANPVGIAYRYTTNVALYAKPTGMLVTGRCNTYDPAFAAARAKRAEVLMYLNATMRPDQPVCALDTKFYMGDLGRVPLWPYPSYGQRSAWPNMRMTDMRAGSAWILHVVKYVENLMRERKVDGVFLDTVGVRPWNKLAEWSSWPQWEKDRYTDGNVDLVKRLDASRRRLNPNFIIVNNNIWDGNNGRGLIAERYVDGVVLEHPQVGSAYHIKYAAKPFGNLGHKRLLILATSKADAITWSKVKGVTHVSSQGSGGQYAYPPPPPVGFTALYDR